MLKLERFNPIKLLDTNLRTNWSFTSYSWLGHRWCRHSNQKPRIMRFMLGLLHNRFIGRFELLDQQELIIILRIIISWLFIKIRKLRLQRWFNGQRFQICCCWRYWIRINLPIHCCYRIMQILIIISQIQEHRLHWCYTKEWNRFTNSCCSTTSLNCYWSWLTSLPTLYIRCYHICFMRNKFRPRCLERRIQHWWKHTILDC